MHGRRFPFAICMVFTLLGVLLLAAGSGEARVTGATSVLFFGVGSLALALPLATRRGAGTVELADVGSERGILLPAARAKQLMIIAACAGIAAACALLWAMTPDAAWIGIGGLVFFGGLGLWRLALLPRRHGLALTPTRLKLLGWGEPELDWDDIRFFLAVARTVSATVAKRRKQFGSPGSQTAPGARGSATVSARLVRSTFRIDIERRPVHILGILIAMWTTNPAMNTHAP